MNRFKSYKARLRLCFWLYLFLLIFEGAFRKWIFPSFSDLFLVARDPIVLYVLIVGITHGLLKNNFGKFFLCVATISFFISLFFGHQNILVACYGFRIYGIHLPALFIWGKILNREDIARIGYFVLYCLIIMAGIMIWQYFTPQSSWINRGVGGDMEGVGFAGAMGYYRPSGTFSFVTGIIGFEALAGSFLFYHIYDFHSVMKLNKYKFVVIFLIFLVSVFFSLSRSVIAEVVIIFIVALCSMFIQGKNTGKSLLILSIIPLLIVLLYNFIPFFHIAVDVLLVRFENASDVEGNFVEGSVGSRYGGSFIRAFFDTQNFTGKDIPFWGFGLGAGSKVGSIMLGLSTGGFGIAEEEWSLVICEYGYVIGGFLLIIGRLMFPLIYAYKAIKLLRFNGDYLPYMFSPFFIISFLTYQLSGPTVLGFTVVAGSIMLAAINTSKYNFIRQNYDY